MYRIGGRGGRGGRGGGRGGERGGSGSHGAGRTPATGSSWASIASPGGQGRRPEAPPPPPPPAPPAPPAPQQPGGYQDKGKGKETDPGQGDTKRRRLLPPTVVFTDGTNPDTSPDTMRQLMVVAERAYPYRLCDTDDAVGHFMTHVKFILGEALSENAIVDIPKEFDEGYDRFFANRVAGEIVQRVGKSVTELRDMANHRDPTEKHRSLDIPYEHQVSLMAKNLHTRYRNMWQLALNAGLIPATDPRQRDLEPPEVVTFRHYGGYAAHKSRYDLATGLGHAGCLRDDLAMIQSRYFEVWHASHTNSRLSVHPGVRKDLHRTLFETLYGLKVDEADWIVTAADKNHMQRAQEWVRLIDRYIFVTDYNYKFSQTREGKVIKTLQSGRSIDQNNAIAPVYRNWIRQLAELVAAQRRKPPSSLYDVSPQDENRLRDATANFHRQALAMTNWNRYQPDRFEFWKPTETFQRQYNEFGVDYDPFGPR